MRFAVVLVVMVLVVVIAVAVAACDNDGGKKPAHKATCWKPDYAANPDVDWAANPSATHRHGAGPRGSNVCGP